MFTLLVSHDGLQNESELFGRTIRVNIAKPQKIKEGSSRAVWADDAWLQRYAGKTEEEIKETTVNSILSMIHHEFAPMYRTILIVHY